MEAAQIAALPASALGQAVSYTLSLWYKLTRFLVYPEPELSNNLAKNSLRGVALGRKNWIHIGSEQARPKVAAILSVIESCRRLRLPVREYLASILPGLANYSVRSVSQLTPAAWAPESHLRRFGNHVLGLTVTKEAHKRTSGSDMVGVSRFVENAMQLLNVAESAAQAGHTPSEMTILISPAGRIRMVADSDWPLDSLQAHHGAKTAYRVSRQAEKVRIDGREGGRTCRFESEDGRRAARLLLGSCSNYSVLALAS